MEDNSCNLPKVLGKLREMTSLRPDQQEQLRNMYDAFAANYDKHVKAVGYKGYKVGAKTLVQFLEQHQFGTDCRILDVGSGTGLVGEELKKLNYTNLDALDPSEKSNDVARGKELYKNFFVEFLGPGKQLSIPSNTYDAAICSAVFIPGHVKAEGAMDEMVRVVKPGGLICLLIREDVMFDKEYGHEAKMAELSDKKAWKLLSNTKGQYAKEVYYGECYVFVYQVL